MLNLSIRQLCSELGVTIIHLSFYHVPKFLEIAPHFAISDFVRGTK